MRIDRVIKKIRTSVDKGGKVMIAGNGGSAAQADHFAAELVCDGIPCISLTNPAIITAIGNDCGYKHVFEYQVAVLGNPGDIFIGLTTSGQSANISRAQITAIQLNMEVVFFPVGKDTQAIQERHLCLLHEIWQGLLK